MGALSFTQPELNPMAQVTRSILSNNSYERKGKLWKKSLNSNTFKERTFVLQGNRLFYYKDEQTRERNFNIVVLLDA